ncbi:glycosyltransferase family 2 protein [Caenimonas terrae]|uniref:Glycosyltransferase family 2 protein n=1 Tax=Caenimonas terrae TaxID=696074 RepID=A0ABW0NEH5_9BURK
MQTIAVLMTCHNRREKTLACLDALFGSDRVIDAAFEVFLVDDGSTDGTGDAVKASYPAVHVITGDGNLYWNGGMRVAFGGAMQTGFDFYLWLNDDTVLYPDAMDALLALANAENRIRQKPVIIVGTTQDAPGGGPTYGGLCRKSIWRPLKHSITFSQTEPTPCETMNGNCVLVPSAVATQLGNLEPAFVHAMGDIDYGLRATKAGFPLVVLPRYVGVCSHNPVTNTFLDGRLSRRDRWAKIMSLKGLPPKQWYVLVRRHAGLMWPLLFVWPYIRVALGVGGKRK